MRSGIHASASYGKRKPGVSTPMTVATRSSTRTVVPITSGRPPNCRCHSEWLSTIAFGVEAGRFFVGREHAAGDDASRPAASSDPGDTRTTLTGIGVSPSISDHSTRRMPITGEKLRASSRIARKLSTRFDRSTRCPPGICV